MPIIITNVEWNQTENTIIIKVPLRGVHHSKVDVFYSPLYLKASFEQYFFEVFLSHPIKYEESSCTFTPSHVLFELIKCEPHTWEKLELELSKADKQQLKMKYMEEEREKLQKKHTEMKEKKAELKRLAVREQMALDAKQHETIENLKKDEKNTALKNMGIWSESEGKKVQPEHKKKRESDRRKDPQRKNYIKDCTPKATIPIPPPRTTATLNVSFTPREFPTPCRESRLEEEDEWLRKQAEARRSVGFISEDLRPEEHNPQFLQSKGDDFLRSRNYLAAISAYSFEIKLSDKFPALYVGRAEAHLALGNYNKTIQDCSRALELMKPEVPANLRERAACIGRRGVALVSLGLVKEGIGELTASLRLVPDETLSLKLEEAMEKLNETDNDNK